MNQHFCILSSKKHYKTYEDLFEAFRKEKEVAVMDFTIEDVKKWMNDYKLMKIIGLHVIQNSIDCLYPKLKKEILIKDKKIERQRLEKIIKDTKIELIKLNKEI